jgi:GT2 family glycosyltransferase
MIGCPTETITVEWLPTTASVWRRRVFEGHRFDERFRGYSYLEDLDFSYRVGRDFRLAVVASARFAHWPAPAGRGNDFQFGRREVKARLYFVAKHAGLSRLACLEALALRFGISLVAMVRDRRLAFARRAFGNLVGLAECLAQRDAL